MIAKVKYATKASGDDEIPTHGVHVEEGYVIVPEWFTDAMIGDCLNIKLGGIKKLYRVKRRLSPFDKWTDTILEIYEP